ncbi:hypothetical protein [Magnetospirillum sp. 64-120]|uniref:hypothetical protein n=1 Tax=Magnetospirillum sp. 64-120 TaxID=1895778 RepID=UPI0009293627|nr:hypothetical protein [Magnetospirillum sp. 64-120]OJX72675.1 MAG: hypothetical protein BGO92_20095 [Magnetospirillum sp. 64-120]
MSLTRYSTELADSFQLPLERPALWLRSLAPWFILALAASVAGKLGLLANPLVFFAVTAFAVGGFAVGWQRLVALDETPGWRIGPRHLLWALAYQLMLGFESFPTLLLGPSLSTMENGPVIGIAVREAFQLLIGPMFLILPHIALYRRGEGGASLQEMTLAGGLAVGLGYVLSGLPFVVIGEAWRNLVAQMPAGSGLDVVDAVVQAILTFATISVMSAFYAKVWKRLRVEAPRLGRGIVEDPNAPPAEPSEPAKPRRTERLQKKKR